MTVKTICDHCGKKQKATLKNYSLNNVTCKFCGKDGYLKETNK